MLLEAANLTFGYSKAKPVLCGASLSVAAGERVALVGPSGCGKSTLALILAGYLEPWSGGALLDGQPLPRKGFCPVQLIHQHPEKAFNPRRKMRSSLAEAWEPGPDSLEEMGIEAEWLGRYPKELSAGELQRFSIARALAPKTRFVIADEMSTMLDAITQAQIWELMLAHVERRGLGLLAVTHSLDLARRVCDRVVALQDGLREQREARAASG